mgnify:CR=1 FL=1
MTVIGNQVVCPARYGTITEFIIVGVGLNELPIVKRLNTMYVRKIEQFLEFEVGSVYA